MLFTCGPCALGASINEVLHRHPQESFEYGSIDLFATERRRLNLQQGTGNEYKRFSDDGGDGDIAISGDDPRLVLPGRSILLKQDKDDMGAHRFTLVEKNIIVAATDLPDSDDRPKSLVHYSKSHEKYAIYGLHNLYSNNERANEVIQIQLDSEDRYSTVRHN